MRLSARPSAYRVVLNNRPFVALWLGQTVSRFGDTLYDLALLWYVLDATGSALAAGGIAIAASGGRLVGSLVAGMILDRLPARRIMLAVELLRCALTAALGAGWLLGFAPPLALLYALACALALGGALFQPARLAAIPHLVARESLVTANALDQLSASLVATLAWGASGVVVALLGPARGLLIDSATFLASLLAVAWARWSAEPASDSDPASPLRALLTGARWLRDNHLGQAVLVAQLVQAFAGGAFFAAIGPHLQRDLGGGATTYGIQGTAYGIALLLGSWAIGHVAVRRVGLLYAAGFIVNGLVNSGFALASSLNTLLPAAFVAGLGAAAFITGELTLLQANIPAAVRGRVIALTILLATAVGMAALALGGWLADHTQIRSVMLLASLIHIAIGVVLWSLPRLRHFHLTADCEEDRS
jgi:MFS family permease